MPYVNIRLGKNGITKQQKEDLIREVTRLIVEIAKKDPNAVNVIIDEIDPDNWGVAGETLTVRRARAATKK